MATFEKAKPTTHALANEILCAYESHKPLLDAKVRIDIVFAFAEQDENGEPVGPALVKGGLVCRGLCRKLPLKDRAMGRGDAEITLDGDWWSREASEEQQRAVLDHELHHISVVIARNGAVKTDDIGRPVIKLRKHDFEVGWFNIIAERHGEHSVERKQAKSLMDNFGQYYFPGIAVMLPRE